MLFLQILINSLVIGTQVLLLAAGLYLIYAVTRIYHIALAGIMISGPYFYYSLQFFLPPFLAFVFALAGSFIIGMLSYGVIKDLAEEKQNLLALLISIAMWLFLESFFAMLYGSGGIFLMEGVLPTFQFGGIILTQVGFWTIILGFIVAIFAYFILYFLPLGRQVRAVAQHVECASLIGVNQAKVKLGIFALTGALAGLIGIFTAMNNALIPSLGGDLIIIAFIALLVGGLQNFKGTIYSSYLLVIISEFFISGNWGGVSFSASWKMFIIFVFALGILLIRPQGIFAQSLRKS